MALHGRVARLHRQAVPALEPASPQHSPSSGSAHAGAEAVNSLTATLLRLIGTFRHRTTRLEIIIRAGWSVNLKSRSEKPKNRKTRADLLLVRRGLAPTREKAQAMIMAGSVRLPSGLTLKAGTALDADAELVVLGRLPYVSRGGIKLAHALAHFALDVRGLAALDIGASTGGFVDCLLQHGASSVQAVDVGHGQMAESLRRDPRVTVLEGVNAHYPFALGPSALGPFALGMQAGIATIDVSFISITKVLPNVLEHLSAGAPIVALVKPQFEALRGEVPRGGVIKDPRTHARVLGRVIKWAVDNRLRVRGLTASPILGDAGNREFFLLLKAQDELRDGWETLLTPKMSVDRMPHLLS